MKDCSEPGWRGEKEARRTRRLQALLQKADQHYRQGHRWRAIWNYRKALSVAPDHVPALVNLGLIYSLTRGKHAIARQMLHRALELDPKNPLILLNLATLTAQAGDPARALALLEEAERLAPDYPDVHYNKAYLYAQDRRWENARQEIERELKINPANLNAILMQKAIESQRGDRAEPPS